MFLAAAMGEPPLLARGLAGEREQVLPSTIDLADAESLLASMPADVLPDRAPLPVGSRMPLAPNPLFVGRADELLQVARALRGGGTTVALGQVVASTGLGGLGKTQLAVEFVHRYGRFFAGGVFWLSFASADEVPLQVAACAGSAAMDLAPGIDGLPLEERVQRVQRAWQDATPRLLVFDNCEEEALLEVWRPTSGGCRVLVTSRRSTWLPTLGIIALPLDLLPRADSIALLCRYQPDLAADNTGLDALAAELGDLPLALHLAGSYLCAYRAEVGLDDYLSELRRSEVIHHASLLAGFDDSPSPTRHVQSVAQTFALCLARLDRGREVDRVAIALLARMACMAPGEPVPHDLISRALDGVDLLLRAGGIRRLGTVGLVEEGKGWLRLHRLLAHFVRQEGLEPGALPAVDRALITCGEDAYQGHLTGAALAAAIPHLVGVAAAADGSRVDVQMRAELFVAAGRALHYAGDHRAARPWYERGLAVWETVHGPNHPDTARGLNNLAFLLKDRGELVAARPLAERALGIRERVLGPDHPDTALSLNDLALLLRDQGELSAARRLFERALAIRERVQGPEHPQTARGLNNLALLLLAQGELSAARPLFERALAIRERALGPEHPDTARGLNNLALLLFAQGDLDTAGYLAKRALAIRERVLGPDHPEIANSLNNVARLFQARGELPAARVLYERSLDIRERVLGPEHPDTARGLNNLARLLRAEGKLAAARAIAERALDVRERVLGPDHPDTAYSLNDMAVLLQCQGGLDTARPLFERALNIREGVLGPDHPDTATTLNGLALLHREEGDPAAARPLFERALAIRENVLGADHPDTVATRRALAELADEGDGAAPGG